MQHAEVTYGLWLMASFKKNYYIQGKQGKKQIALSQCFISSREKKRNEGVAASSNCAQATTMLRFGLHGQLEILFQNVLAKRAEDRGKLQGV